MDESRKPRSREKKVVTEGKGVEKKGEGLGTGPLNNTGSYADRREQAGAARTAQPSPFAQTRPQQTESGRTARPTAPNSQSRPQQTSFGQSRPQQTGSSRPAQQAPFGQSRPQQTGSSRASQQTPYTRPRPQQTGGGRAAGGAGGSSTPTRGATRGGGGKLLLIILAVVALLGGGGGLSGLFGSLLGGGDSDVSSVLDAVTSGNSYSSSTSGNTYSSSTSGNTYSGSSSGTGAGSLQSGSVLEGTGAQSVGSDMFSSLTGSSDGSGLTDLLSAFLGSSSGSVYDFNGDFSSLFGGAAGNPYTGASSGTTGTALPTGAAGVSSTAAGGSASAPDTTVSSKAREKFTTIRGNKRDTVTLLVYLCGTDLESQSGMGTSDLKEMTQATLGKNINLIVYTGGCRRWRNNVVSSSVNQIYQIQDGKLYCLEKNLGSAAMTDPGTLTSFIRYGAENFPANRMCLILWDHGGGSVSGYGYDEKYGSGRSMSLAGINTALKNAGQKFDFIGFDACLMATVENGLMLSQYADYMIASEETEPGVGWYYTNWLTKLGSNPSLPTVEIGKMIADDFVSVCAQQCRGQGTTLSVVDLTELQATVPSALSAFSKDTSQLIQNKEYKTVSSARSRTREFAQSTRIDQIDLAHFAGNLGSAEGRSLVSVLKSAVKYNRTGGGMTNANGLSIYFPYKTVGKVSQMVNTYEAIGMDAEYARCIQEFASLEMSGQVSAGTSLGGYSSQSIGSSSLLSSLLGTGSYTGGISSDPSDMADLLGGLFGGGSSSGGYTGGYTGGYSGGYGDLFSFFGGRSLTATQAAEYLAENHLDASALVWNGNRIALSPDQWDQVESLAKNLFVDDGAGYIDLGMDAEFTLEGDALIDDFDGTALSIDGQPIAYYYMNTVDDGENYVINGYTPALLNGQRVNLMILFDNDNPYGVISGALPVYPGGETETVAKNLIQVGEGDVLQFLCDYYDYKGNYQDSYALGDPLTLGAETEIANTPVGRHPVRVTYCFTDYYQQRYWTPARVYQPEG